MFKIISIILVLFISFEAIAKIRLNISIIYKKGIDKGLVLVSEYHSVEEVHNNEEIELKMKDELKMWIKTAFVYNPKDYGPSRLLLLKGGMNLKGHDIDQSFFNEEIILFLNEKKTLSYKDNEGHLIELSITPQIR